MSPTRPRRLVVVAGTATEIGKTWVSAALSARLVDDAWAVEARKPAQSGGPGDASDADLLAAATGEDPMVVCPSHRRYSVPMAPPMAAEALGLVAPTIAELADEVTRSWGARAADVGLVELAGGVASPAAADGDGADLAAALAPDIVLLVADAGLGTINSVRLSIDRLRSAAPESAAPESGMSGSAVLVPPPIVVFLNRFDANDDLHLRNAAWLRDRDGFTVVTDLGLLAAEVLAMAPPHCGYCGKPTTECARECVRPLDPDHFCVRCGRRLVVSVSPMRHSARCKVHGTHCA